MVNSAGLGHCKVMLGRFTWISSVGGPGQHGQQNLIVATATILWATGNRIRHLYASALPPFGPMVCSHLHPMSACRVAEQRRPLSERRAALVTS